jgi:release factor glutamine methyltransferase
LVSRASGVTFSALRNELRRRLSEAGVGMPDLEASELLSLASGLRKQEMVMRAREPVPEKTKNDIEALLSRRLAGEPLAYILGQWDFCGLTLEINSDVLIPRGDTEGLAELAWYQLAGRDGVCVLDLCSGSGCIGLAVAARVPGARVTLCDCSPAAIALSRRNAGRLNLPADFLRHDILRAPPPGRWDMIVCNPPYIRRDDLPLLDRSVYDYEPLQALDGGDDGLDFYRALARWKASCLTESGVILLECGQGQAENIAALFAPLKTRIYPDTRGIERYIHIQY